MLSTKKEIELDTPPHLWMPLGCRADLAVRLELWAFAGSGTRTSTLRHVKEMRKNDRLRELMYSEEA